MENEIPLAHKIIAQYVTPIMFIVGVLGNILSIIVFRKKVFRTSTSVYLLMLAIISLGFLIFYFPYVFKEFVHNGSDTYVWTMISYQCYIGSFAVEIMALCGSWMTLAVTIERCLVVSMPLKSRIFCRRKTAWFVCLGIFIVAALINIPKCMECRPIMVEDPTAPNNITVDMTMNKLPGYNMPMAMLGGILISSIIPFIIVFISNIVLVAFMMQRWTNRRNLTADGNTSMGRNNPMTAEKRAITILVIANTSLYLVAHAMTSFIHLKVAIKGIKFYYEVMDESLGFYSNTLVLTFFCFSSVVYIIISSMFRKKAKKVITSVVRHSQAWSSSLTTSFRSRTRNSHIVSHDASSKTHPTNSVEGKSHHTVSMEDKSHHAASVEDKSQPNGATEEKLHPNGYHDEATSRV